MNLPEEFWQANRGLLLVDEAGELRFTARGRAHFASLMAKYGFSISNVNNLAQFCEVMGEVNAGELEENERAMRSLLEDPDTTEEERAAIRRVLGL